MCLTESAATRRATSPCTRAASAVPSISLSAVGAASVSARKVHRSGLANQHHLDLSRILQLGFDAPGDLFGHGRHARVVDVVRQHDHSHLAPGLNGEDLFDALV